MKNIFLGAALAAASLFTGADRAEAALVALYDFDSATPLVDQMGNFSNLTLNGTATVHDGALDVNGSGTNSTGWARATYTGTTPAPAFNNMTLVSWVSLQSYNAWAGSALTVDTTTIDRFTGMIFAENPGAGPQEWQVGSNNGVHNTGSFAWSAHQDLNETVQLVYTLADVANGTQITGYINGVSVGSYLSSNNQVMSLSSTEILFGMRHTTNTAGTGGPGALDALIYRAEVWNEALDATAVAALYTAGTLPAVPLPAGMPLMLAGLGAFGLLRRRKK